MMELPMLVEQYFTTPAGTLAARVWGQVGGIPILALHGWQDNAASHDALIPLLLAGLHGSRLVVAADLPGHGFSEHKHDATAYTLADYLSGLAVLPRTLHWQRYILLGHSLGAALCAYLAALYPKRIVALVMIDSVGPLTTSPGVAATQLRRSLAMQRHQLRPRYYADLEAMAQRRAEAGDLSIAAARILVARNHRRTDQGLVWRNDPKLRWLTPVYMSEAQTQAVLGEVQAPTLIIRAKDGLLTNTDLVSVRCRCFARAKLETLPGHHHLHMDAPHAVASSVIKFLHNVIKGQE